MINLDNFQDSRKKLKQAFIFYSTGEVIKCLQNFELSQQKVEMM